MKIFDNFWPWDIDRIVEALKNRHPINEGLYFIFYFIFISLSMFSSPPNRALNITLVLIDIIGFIVLFKINLKTGGQDYIKKLVCLSVPAAIRFFFITTFILIIFSFFIREKNFYDTWKHGVLILGNICSYYYIGLKILRT